MYFLLLSVNSAPDTDNSCEKHPQSGSLWVLTLLGLKIGDCKSEKWCSVLEVYLLCFALRFKSLVCFSLPLLFCRTWEYGSQDLWVTDQADLSLKKRYETDCNLTSDLKYEIKRRSSWFIYVLFD